MRLHCPGYDDFILSLAEINLIIYIFSKVLFFNCISSPDQWAEVMQQFVIYQAGVTEEAEGSGEDTCTSPWCRSNMGAQTQTLVSAKWLADMVQRNLVGPRLRVLDASWYLPAMKRDGKEEFARTHIPGASFFDIDECSDRTSGFDHTLPTPQLFADYVGSLGVGDRSHVVVYDASDYGAFSCTRVWWMFRVFGHTRVSVLNGGFRNWVREGHPVSGTCSGPGAARFTASVQRAWVKSFEDVAENMETRRFQLVDVRPYGRFCGQEPEPREG